MSAFILVSAALLSWAMDPAPGPSVPFWWTAYPEADNTLLVNPAGSAWLNSSSMRLGFVMSDSTFERFDRFSIQDASGGLSGWWDDSQDLRRFTASGAASSGNLSAGAGYTWYKPTVSGHPQSGAGFFTFGLNYRPSTFLGFGATARTRAGDMDPCYIAGIALRPGSGNSVVFTGDYRLETGDIESRWSAGAEFMPMEGLTIRAAMGEGKTYTAGIQLDFGKASLAAASELPDWEYQGTTAEVILSDRPSRSIFQPLPDFLTYTADQGGEQPSRAFLGPRVPSFTEKMSALSRGADDPSVRGILVDFSNYSLNAAQSEELREVLVRYRNAGKPVYAYMDYAGNGSFYAASAADAICIHKAGQISVSGFTAYSFFVRGMLDRLGLYPDLMHIGDYKNASDMLTEYAISDAQIEATRALLETMKAEQARGFSEGLGLEPAQMSALFSGSPFAGESMVTMGFADTLLFRDQFEDFVEHRLGRSVSTMSTEFYCSIQEERSRWGSVPRVAVVVATGSIVMGESGSGIMGRTMGSETVVAMLEEAAAAEGVRAIVLRIDSGGGDAMASADMHRAVERIREKMPVVVSMGGVAASGGYYMAAGADAIFAGKMTITGSIGIISGKLVYGDLLGMIGINVERVEIEPAGNPGNPFEAYTPHEYSRQFEAMSQGYDLFVNTVAEGRNMTWDEVDAIGQGRVWSGSDALDLGLVDYNGGVTDAIAHAAHLAGMGGAHPEVVVYPRLAGLGSLSLSPFGTVSLAETVRSIGQDPLLNARGPLYLAPVISVE